jgi:ribonuclease D
VRMKTLGAVVKCGYPLGPYHWRDARGGWGRVLWGQAVLDSRATAGEQP